MTEKLNKWYATLVAIYWTTAAQDSELLEKGNKQIKFYDYSGSLPRDRIKDTAQGVGTPQKAQQTPCTEQRELNIWGSQKI